MSRPLDPRIRSAYVRQIAKVVVADGRVDADELVKLYEVFALLGVPEAERLELLSTLAYDFEALQREPVAPEILDDPELRASLAKDALFFDEERRNEATRRVARAIVDGAHLTGEQVEVLTKWVHVENTILKKLGAGEEWMASTDLKELSARATSVGLPLTALYFAGTTGLSAVGITSGLASIGAYTGLTVLGLNPMTAGIAGLILGGVAVKKIADYALGNKNKHAEELRQRIEVIRAVHVKAATALAGDVVRFEAAPPRDAARAAVVLTDMRRALESMETLRA